MKIVIIGLGTAGFAAALAIRKVDRKAEIAIIDKKDFDLLHLCGLPYVLERKLHSFSKLQHDIHAKMMNIKVINRSLATKIDHDNRIVIYKNLGSNQENKISYDRVIISPGSYTFVPPIEGVDNNLYIHTVSNLKDTEKLDRAIEQARSAVVIGAGAIGLETAHALKKRDLKVTVIDMLPSTFPKSIDPDISKILEEYLKKKQIDLKLGRKLEKISKKKIYLDGEQIESDIIVMATGVRPRIRLAGDSGIPTDKSGIIVDERLETGIKDIYAAGDCITVDSIITKKKFPAWLATTAYKQGTVAGINAAGGDARFPGTTGAFVSVIGDMEVAAVGLNSLFAEKFGYDIAVGKSTGLDLPDWMPGGQELTVKVIADKQTKKIIGAQAIGKGAASRVNVVAAAIRAGMSLKRFSDTEFAYCPAVSQAYDVLSSAVDVALRKTKQ